MSTPPDILSARRVLLVVPPEAGGGVARRLRQPERAPADAKRMSSSELFRIPGTVVVKHYAQQRAMLVSWESLSTPHFREAMTRALAECGRMRVKTWLADLTRNPGVPSQSDLTWLANDCRSLTLDSGIRALINVHGTSAVAKLGSNRWSKGASAGGLVTADCFSLAEALELATEVAIGKLRADAK